MATHVLTPRQMAIHTFGPTAAAVLEHLPQQPCLIVLNYHRIGDPEATPYDPGVFSATPEQFDAQVAYLKRHYALLHMDEAVELIQRKKAPRQASVVLTFDDGYRDNYEYAFPILRAHRASAAFYLATSYLGSSVVPWWDRIAYMIKDARKPILNLGYPATQRFDLRVEPTGEVIRKVLNLYKAPATRDPERFISELAAACGCELPEHPERLFMTWDEAAEMARGGMTIGSHTHSHRLLSKLSPDEQFDELLASKQLLEHRLHTRVNTLAYPVGIRTAFSRDSKEAARKAGYDAAFSFYGGVNRLDTATEPFDVRRMAVDADLSEERFRLRVALAGFTGRYVM